MHCKNLFDTEKSEFVTVIEKVNTEISNFFSNNFKFVTDMKYIKSKRTIRINGAPEDRYIAKVYRADDIDLETIANEISHATSISYPDLLAAIKALEIHISKHVINGSAVKFGMLGAFIPTIRSKAVRTVDEVDTSVVKRITCRFYPSKAFRESLKSTNLESKDLSKIKYN